MSTKLTPGKKLRRALDAAAKAAGMELTDVELAVTLPLIETTADRIGKLKEHLDAMLNSGELVLRAVQTATEVRMAEAQLAKLIDGLGIDADDDVSAAPKSPQHQAAARTRWDRRSHRQTPA